MTKAPGGLMVQISWLSESCRVMFRAHVLECPLSIQTRLFSDDFASWNFLWSYGPIAMTSNSVFRFDNQSEAGRSMQNCLSGLPLIQTRRWRDPRLICSWRWRHCSWSGPGSMWLWHAMATLMYCSSQARQLKHSFVRRSPQIPVLFCRMVDVIMLAWCLHDACMMLASPWSNLVSRVALLPLQWATTSSTVLQMGAIRKKNAQQHAHLFLCAIKPFPTT